MPSGNAECPPKKPLYVCTIIKEPFDPSPHGRGAGMVFTVQVIRSDNALDGPADHLSIIMLVRDQAVR